MAIGNSILNQDDLEALEYFDTAFRDGSLCNEANIASLAKQFVKDALERANQDA